MPRRQMAAQSKIPAGCICLGDGLFGMPCPSSEHACMACGATGEERSGVCHCGTSLNLHSVYENHTAVEMTRTCEICGGTGKWEVPSE